MGKIYGSALELIGNTPLVEVKNVEKSEGLEATILAKLEYFNPAVSVKDRIGKAMIEDAEQRGVLKPGATIIEPTLMVSGMVRIVLYPLAAAIAASPIPVLPDVGSMLVAPGFRTPLCSASSIIAMTANAYDEDRRKAQEAGMDGFLAKPLDVDEMMRLLAQIIKTE